MYIVSYMKLGQLEYVVYNVHDDAEVYRSHSWEEANAYVNSFN